MQTYYQPEQSLHGAHTFILQNILWSQEIVESPGTWGQISRGENCSLTALSGIRPIMLDSRSEPSLQGVLKPRLSPAEWGCWLQNPSSLYLYTHVHMYTHPPSQKTIHSETTSQLLWFVLLVETQLLTVLAFPFHNSPETEWFQHAYYNTVQKMIFLTFYLVFK